MLKLSQIETICQSKGVEEAYQNGRISQSSLDKQWELQEGEVVEDPRAVKVAQEATAINLQLRNTMIEFNVLIVVESLQSRQLKGICLIVKIRLKKVQWEEEVPLEEEEEEDERERFIDQKNLLINFRKLIINKSYLSLVNPRFYNIY